MAERRHIALLLQLETDLIDAARGVDGEHELQIDVALRQRWEVGRHDQERASEALREPMPDVHRFYCRTLHSLRCVGACSCRTPPDAPSLQRRSPACFLRLAEIFRCNRSCREFCAPAARFASMYLSCRVRA